MPTPKLPRSPKSSNSPKSPRFRRSVADKRSGGPYSECAPMSSAAGDADPLAASQVAAILGPRERLEFEHLLQWLRLSFLATPILVLIAYGLAAVPYALWITGAVAVSFCW